MLEGGALLFIIVTKIPRRETTNKRTKIVGDNGVDVETELVDRKIVIENMGLCLKEKKLELMSLR